MKKILTFILAFALCMSSFANTGANAAEKGKTEKKVALSRNNAQVGIGMTLKLKLKYATGDIVWKSSKENVATVSAKGKVKGISAGSCKITAEYEGKTYTCKVKVFKNVPIKVDGYTINGFSKVFQQIFAIDFKDSKEYAAFYKELQAYGNYGTFLFSYEKDGSFDDDNFVILIKNLGSAATDNPDSSVLSTLLFAMIGTEEVTDLAGNTCKVYSAKVDPGSIGAAAIGSDAGDNDDSENADDENKETAGVYFIYYPTADQKDFDCLIIFCDDVIYDRISWKKVN